jgi:hypothetical protein
MSDGVFVNGSGIELTTAWSVQAAYVHVWSPEWSSAIGGGYGRVEYDSQAAKWFSGALCGVAGTGATASANVSFGVGGAGPNTCSPNYSYLESGTGVRWHPLPGLNFSAELLRVQIWMAFHGGGTIIASPPGARPTGIYNFTNEGIWAGYFKVQRAFSTGAAAE